MTLTTATWRMSPRQWFESGNTCYRILPDLFIHFKIGNHPFTSAQSGLSRFSGFKPFNPFIGLVQDVQCLNLTEPIKEFNEPSVAEGFSTSCDRLI